MRDTGVPSWTECEVLAVVSSAIDSISIGYRLGITEDQCLGLALNAMRVMRAVADNARREANGVQPS